MNMESFDLQQHRHNRENETINLKRIFLLLLRRWYYFPIVMILTLAAAYLYNRYTMPTYLVTSTILIEEENNSNLPGSDEIMQGIGLRPSTQNLDNQIYVFKSWTLISKTLDLLPFEIDYYKKGRIMTSSYYPDHPIEVVPDTAGKIPYNLEFSLTHNSKSSFRLTTEKNDFFQMDTVVVFGQKIEYNNGVFTINRKPDYEEVIKSDGVIYFAFRNKEMLTQSYKNRLKAAPVSRDATIVLISLEGTNRKKDQDFLNMLTEVYMTSNLEKKN